MEIEFTTSDRIFRATGEKAPIRLVLLDASVAARSIVQKHQAKGYAGSLLGETMVSALLLASRLKSPGTVQLRMQMTGDISLVAADATPLGLVRAMIPSEDLRSTGNFEPIVLPQLLKVRKLDAEGSLLAESLVEMPSASVSESLTHYLEQSEQVTALIRVGCATPSGTPLDLEEPSETTPIGNLKDISDEDFWCAGFLIEAFPDADLGTRSAWLQRAKSIQIEDYVSNGKVDLETLLQSLKGPESGHVHQTLGIAPFCPCSRAGVLTALSSLPREELESMVIAGEDAELHCEFCRQRYTASTEEIKTLLEIKEGDNSDSEGSALD